MESRINPQTGKKEIKLQPLGKPAIWVNNDLCDHCLQYGFCKLAHPFEARKIDTNKFLMGDSEISNLVNVNYENAYNYRSEPFIKKHLQAAFNAFHQQDYETAIINSEVVLAENPLRNEALFCIAVSNYFLEDYEKAIDYAQRASVRGYSYPSEYKIEWFLLHCQNKQRKSNSTEISSKAQNADKVLCSL